MRGPVVAIIDVTAWIPEQWGGAPVMAMTANSVTMGQGRHEAMSLGDTKHVPRTGEMDVDNLGKGENYPEDDALNDEILLKARKLTGGAPIAEEDLRDAAGFIDIVNTKKLSWATSFAKAYDNATLGVSGAESDTANVNRPFTSVYKLVRTTDGDLAYTADANYNAGAVTYDELNTTAELLESSPYFDHGNTICIASPSYLSYLRGVKDSQNRPIFLQSSTADPSQPGVRIGNLFTYPLYLSQGCRVSAAMTKAPTGNPLLIFANRNFLVNGDKWPMESSVIPPNITRTDEAFLKMRWRGGFAASHPKAFAIFEKTS